MEGVKTLEAQRRRTRRGSWGRNDHTVRRGTGEIRLGTGQHDGHRGAARWCPVAAKPISGKSREGVERRAEVGGGGSSEDGGDNTTPLERRASSQVSDPIGEGWRDCRWAIDPPFGCPRAGRGAGIVGQRGWRRRMPSIDCLGESRVIEKITHGSGRGRWRRSDGPRRRIEPPEGNLWDPERRPGLQVARHRASALLHRRHINPRASGAKGEPSL